MDAFRINVRDIYIDFLVKDDITGVVYENTPTLIPGAMEVTLAPTVASASLYGDGRRRHQTIKVGGYEVTLEHNKIPPPILARMRGQSVDTETGIRISSTKDTPADFAIGWTTDLTDDHVEVTWLPKCTAAPSDKSAQQTTDSIEYSTDSLAITALALEYNDHFEYIADTSDAVSGFTHAKASTFFDKVPILPPASTDAPDLPTAPGGAVAIFDVE